MHFDALTVACVATELQRTIEGGRVQQVIAPDEQSIGMEIYAQRQRFYLLLTGDPRASRVHLVETKLRRGVDKVSPLLLLLRKYVRGSQVTTVHQPDMTERLLYLHFSHPEHGATRLVAELIGQRGNLVLLNDEDVILDCLRRMWESEGVERPLMPKQPYTPPSPQEKLMPIFNLNGNTTGVPLTQLQLFLQTGGPLWRVLVNHFAGVSPTLAREVAWRATGQLDSAAEEADAEAVAAAMNALWVMTETQQWSPGVWQEMGTTTGFAPYTIHGRGEFIATASISAALEQYYNEMSISTSQSGTSRSDASDADERGTAVQEAGATDGYAALRGTVEKQLTQAEQRLQRQLRALAADEPAAGEAETLRTQAEWLLALNHQITPEQSTLDVDLGDRQLRIDLVKDKSPIEQAEQLFARAAKLERAAQIIPERRAQLTEDIAYLAQLQLDLSQAENQPEIAAIQQELQAMGLLNMPTARQAKNNPPNNSQSKPLRYYTDEGFEIVVGRNARQNEQVTFNIAKAEDLWLHARGAPGAHVVVRSGGQAVSEETLFAAARLAAYHSKLVGENAATVIVTPRRFISRAPGGRPGQVLVRQEETVTVPGTLPPNFAAPATDSR